MPKNTRHNLKGGLHAKIWLFLNLGLSTVHENFCRFFVPVVSAGIEVEFQPCVIASSASSGKWARSYVTSEGEPVSVAQYASNVKMVRRWRS